MMCCNDLNSLFDAVVAGSYNTPCLLTQIAVFLAVSLYKVMAFTAGLLFPGIFCGLAAIVANLQNILANSRLFLPYKMRAVTTTIIIESSNKMLFLNYKMREVTN